MIELHYERAGCRDLRTFKDLKELNDWLTRQNELDEAIKIVKIEERS